MSRIYSDLRTCLLCQSSNLRTAVPLRDMSITTPNAIVPEAFADIHRRDMMAPIALMQCNACGHLQVSGSLNPEYLYRDYVYTTSLSVGLPDHFVTFARDIAERWIDAPNSFVVEFGSNDGSLLRAIQAHGARVLGVDPAVRIAAQATQNGVQTIGDFFGPDLAARIKHEHGPADAIIANNVVANIEDMLGVVEGVNALLGPDGVFVFETQYGADVIEHNLLDTIYHEHLSYFLVSPLRTFFDRHGLSLIHVHRNTSKGGSIRVTVQRKGGSRPIDPVVETLSQQERTGGYLDQSVYDAYGARLDALRGELRDLVTSIRAQGAELAGYGASIGSIALISQLDLGDGIDYLIDHDPQKQGGTLEVPGRSLPILGPEALEQRKPGAVIALAWRYADGIKARHADYVQGGGVFYRPVPTVAAV